MLATVHKPLRTQIIFIHITMCESGSMKPLKYQKLVLCLNAKLTHVSGRKIKAHERDVVRHESLWPSRNCNSGKVRNRQERTDCKAVFWQLVKERLAPLLILLCLDAGGDCRSSEKLRSLKKAIAWVLLQRNTKKTYVHQAVEDADESTPLVGRFVSRAAARTQQSMRACMSDVRCARSAS